MPARRLTHRIPAPARRRRVALGLPAAAATVTAAVVGLLPAAAFAGTLSGTVTTVTGDPVSGATIQLIDSGGPSRSTTTAADGSYEIRDLGAYAYRVSTTAPDPLVLDRVWPYGDYLEVPVPEIGTATGDVVLEPAAAIRGTTVDANGNPVAGVRVFGSGGDAVFSGPDGTYVAGKLPSPVTDVNWGGGTGPGAVLYWPGVADERDAQPVSTPLGRYTDLAPLLVTDEAPSGPALPQYAGGSGPIVPTSRGTVPLTFDCPVTGACQAVADLRALTPWGELPVGQVEIDGPTAEITPNWIAVLLYQLNGRALDARLRIAPLGSTDVAQSVDVRIAG